MLHHVKMYFFFFSSLRGTLTENMVYRNSSHMTRLCFTTRLYNKGFNQPEKCWHLKICVRKEYIAWSLELETKSSHFSVNRKVVNYTPVGIDGAENFKLKMKGPNCQALDCAITLDLMKPNV